MLKSLSGSQSLLVIKAKQAPYQFLYLTAESQLRPYRLVEIQLCFFQILKYFHVVSQGKWHSPRIFSCATKQVVCKHADCVCIDS